MDWINSRFFTCSQSNLTWEKFTYTIAGAFGLSPEDTAMYPAYTLDDAVGGRCYQATYPIPPLADKRGYFSITVYGEDKYLTGRPGDCLERWQKLAPARIPVQVLIQYRKPTCVLRAGKCNRVNKTKADDCLTIPVTTIAAFALENIARDG